ncbi:MAG: hypothetical protein MUP90_11220 [Gammaproteobacteria bacterium]|nr:hypothetical protein [Gammaproteobacteria bacterium]
MRVGPGIIISIAFVHLLAGCIGGGVVKPLECQSSYPLDDYVYTRESFGPTKYFHETSPASNPRSKEDFRREFGEPNEIVTIDTTREMWVYNRSAFCGIVPIYIIPIPLGLPVCDEFDHITFENELAVSIHFRRMETAGAFIFLAYGGGEGFHGCPSETPPQQDEAGPLNLMSEVTVIPHTEACQHVAFMDDEILWSDGGTITRIDPVSRDILGTNPIADLNKSPIDQLVGFGSYWSVRKEKANSYLSRFDQQSGELFAFIPLAPEALGVAVGFGSVWVLHEGLLSRVDPQTNQLLATIPLANAYSGRSMVIGAEAVWVTQALPELLRVDPMTNQVTGTFEVALDVELPANYYWIADMAAGQDTLWLLVFRSSNEFWSPHDLDIGLLEFDTTLNATRSTTWLASGWNHDVIGSSLALAPDAVWACLPLGLYVIPTVESD